MAEPAGQGLFPRAFSCRRSERAIVGGGKVSGTDGNHEVETDAASGKCSLRMRTRVGFGPRETEEVQELVIGVPYHCWAFRQ